MLSNQIRRRVATRAVVLFGMSACWSNTGESGLTDPSAAPPVIATAAITCASESGKWGLDLTTTNWTGGGNLWMSADGVYVEEHEIRSVEAAGDGTADRLELNLSFLADFQDVSPGSSTAFNCGTPSLQGLVFVYERGGKTTADCRVFGDAPANWATWSFGECADPIEVTEPE